MSSSIKWRYYYVKGFIRIKEKKCVEEQRAILAHNRQPTALMLLILPQWLSSKGSSCNAGNAGSTLDGEDALEKEMATCSSILAWEIPWTEEPGGL